MTTSIFVARAVLGGVLLVAGIAKLMDRVGAQDAAQGFGLPERPARAVAAALPVFEIGTAAALLPAGSTPVAAATATALFASFALAIGMAMIRGQQPDCHCFGQLHSAPAGWATLVRSVVLAGLASFVAIVGLSDHNAVGSIPRLSSSGWTIVALVVIAAAGAGFGYQLMLQHGRLLVRLDDLEARFGAAGLHVHAASESPQRLPVGTLVLELLAEQAGDAPRGVSKLVASGKPLLILFVAPGCGPCRTLLPLAGEWQRSHAGRLSVAVVSRTEPGTENGDLRDEFGLEQPGLEDAGDVFEMFGVRATPSGVLIDASGAVAAPYAAGQRAIEDLMALALERTDGATVAIELHPVV